MDAERINWIRLSRANLTARQMKALAERFGTATEILAAPKPAYEGIEGITEAGIAKLEKAKTDAGAEKDLERLERMQAHVLLLSDPGYPACLKQIYDPPPVLYVRGTLEDRDKMAFAIVGTRKCTEYGVMVSTRVARDLAVHGVTVVSGLAYGVDRAAHEGALAGGGRTIGVSACGLDVVYPVDHKGLFDSVAAQGAVVAEAPLGARPDRWRFPARNRIISGLSLGVLVVEAPERSGALITATCAAEQGREVFAIPGNVLSGTSKGVHKLIRDGAKLVDDVSDILSELRPPGSTEVFQEAPKPPPPPARTKPDLTPKQARILNLLSLEQKSVDKIIEESALGAGEVNSELTLLELKGLVRRLPGNSYILAP